MDKQIQLILLSGKQLQLHSALLLSGVYKANTYAQQSHWAPPSLPGLITELGKTIGWQAWDHLPFYRGGGEIVKFHFNKLFGYQIVSIYTAQTAAQLDQ